MENKLRDLLQKESDFWKQRAKVFWLTDGDVNTKFFHQKASNRKKKSEIKGLFNSAGVWCDDDESIEDVVVDYYSNLFTSSNPSDFDDAVRVVPRLITPAMNDELVAEIDGAEVLASLNSMHPSKSPGPDGFSPGSTKRFGRLWVVM